ncbi:MULTISPECIES: 3-hexulose-6-phosphate synthase [Clostridium]|uniref:3-hexulose-6-phosphate synthase n=1 Tax=Clostridium TaxID=1485 RepID=UPI000288E56F|nr:MULTISPECIES: 3-hexulose-6-phosphate synthase [Clostridium]MDF2504677.1 bifunctional hexulose-6-phosphate synthase/ribonuclease regulator [Clostridium sp.]
MKIQLALDRFTVPQAIEIADEVRMYIDWIEVGTSLIKEFGMESVRELRKAFPEKIIVADIKTFDNAKYEFEMCFNAGADIATVMGAAPMVSIDTCINVARNMGKQVMIDLLNISSEQLQDLCKYEDAIFCLHISKDMQELTGIKQELKSLKVPNALRKIENVRLALAGGINLEFLNELGKNNAEVAIIGSSITKAEDKVLSARSISEAASKIKGGEQI